MPGSIRRRGNSYVLRLYAGSEGGRKRWKWFSFKTRTEAEAAQVKLASHVRAHSAGTGFFGSPRERLAPYLEDWLDRQRCHIAPRTAERYETFIAQVRRDPLGTIPLGRLSPRALEAYYGRRLSVGLSPTTVNHHHRLLHKTLRDAVRQDLIVQNPASVAQAPRRARSKPDMWTESQVLLFLSQARVSSANFPLYLFIAGTGVRVGEALGLAWQALDLQEGIVHIEQALQRALGGGYLLRDPKSVRSRRTIALPPEIVGVLCDLRVCRDEERRRRGCCAQGSSCITQACPGWHETGLVFTQPNGKPLHANNLRQRDLHRLCKRLGLSSRRALHNLRHAHATHLLQRGVNIRVVQERLGHATPSFTLATYSHVLAGMQQQAVRAVSAMLGTCTSPAPPLARGEHAQTLDP